MSTEKVLRNMKMPSKNNLMRSKKKLKKLRKNDNNFITKHIYFIYNFFKALM